MVGMLVLGSKRPHTMLAHIARAKARFWRGEPRIQVPAPVKLDSRVQARNQFLVAELKVMGWKEMIFYDRLGPSTTFSGGEREHTRALMQ